MKKSELKSMTEEQLRGIAMERGRKGRYSAAAIAAQKELWKRDEGLRYPDTDRTDPEILYNGKRNDPYN